MDQEKKKNEVREPGSEPKVQEPTQQQRKDREKREAPSRFIDVYDPKPLW